MKKVSRLNWHQASGERKNGHPERGGRARPNDPL